MGKPPNLIADIGKSPNIDHEKDMAANGVSPKATKAMYVVIIIGFLVLFALVVVGLHIPSGG